MARKKRRITRNALHIRMAELISLRGTCGRLQVGALATFENRVIATGYNGPRAGETHCNNHVCDLSTPCTRAVHAEENLILWAKKERIMLDGSILYCTHQPCIKCAQMIFKAGISEVYYLNSYRLIDGLNYLKEHGIKTFRITRAGSTKV